LSKNIIAVHDDKTKLHTTCLYVKVFVME